MPAQVRGLGRGPGRGTGRHHVRDQRVRPAASGRTTTTASATDGWLRTAAATSPGSIRKPRTFTWSSARPRYSRPPPGCRRARSPVR
ncbi:hypothetical protein BJF78_32420 [Pseudonocardia sp. CNS-139]|nr:hypothetical protein BJF78_32420 [Pseudonocardia sp. CNS-139]